MLPIIVTVGLILLVVIAFFALLALNEIARLLKNIETHLISVKSQVEHSVNAQSITRDWMRKGHRRLGQGLAGISLTASRIEQKIDERRNRRAHLRSSDARQPRSTDDP